jgi:hypothetical protein
MDLIGQDGGVAEALKRFRAMGRILYEDPAGDFEIIAGDIFEGATTRGNTNLIVALRVIDGYMLYSHGDKVKKVPLSQFIRAVESGDIEYRNPKEIDVERLSMAIIALDAMANRRSFEEAVHVMEDQFVHQMNTGNEVS